MKRILKLSYLAAIATVGLLDSCKKNQVYDSLSKGNFTDTAGTLKAAAVASFPNMGMAVTYTPMSTIATYLATAKREANVVTFGNELKNGSIVRSDGTFNYTTADNLFNLCTTNGLAVYGHTLCWYQQNAAVYYNTLTKGSGTSTVNLLANGDFETGTSTTSFPNWSAYNGASSISAGTVAESHGGNRSFKATVAAAGNAYAVQLASDLFNTTVGTNYKMTFWLKAAAAGGKMRISTGTTAQYSADYNTTTDWQQYTYTFAAKDAQTRVLFDVGYVADTYYIDDVSVTDASAVIPPTGPQVAAAVDNALKTFITTTVTRYAGKIKAWDVVNEPMTDAGALRTNANYTIPAANISDQFLWSQYLGRSFALKAFQYAKAADPSALLFINEYNLEYSNAKLDSLIAYVGQIQAANGSPIVDGIGTQMHINLGISQAGIDNAFIKLAKTGLKIRISELDVTTNGAKANPFTADGFVLAYQAAMYKYVIQSYLKNVPAAQRYGVTIWGVYDTESYLNTATVPDVPLLFDKNFVKKPAYSGVLQALKGQ